MITPKIQQPSEAVALHYNELDAFYREIWGNHVHHGYWRTGKETSAEAAEALAELVAARLDLSPGMRVCDIGCGYGETARLFSSRYAVSLEGVTISESQFRVAAGRKAPGVSISLCDWLQNPFPDENFDRAYAIESSEHIGDKARFFSEAHRVLRPGGRLVVCAWLENGGAAEWEKRFLLEPICRYGRLPGMGTEEDYRAFAEAAGFEAVASDDISAKVRRTWSICIRRSLAKLASDRRYRAFLFARGPRNKAFALTLFLIQAAYATGAMRYCVLTCRKPQLP
jgi:tocopherol O-methyltransferase